MFVAFLTLMITIATNMYVANIELVLYLSIYIYWTYFMNLGANLERERERERGDSQPLGTPSCTKFFLISNDNNNSLALNLEKNWVSYGSSTD